MIRFLDMLLAILGLIFLFPVLIFLYVVGLADTGSPIFRQKRMGINQIPFWLFKFRSMHINTQSVATHLVEKSSVTRWGKFLRKSKLDELPQLFNVLKGDMSFVGPRPNIFNQDELIKERLKRGLYYYRPGITGLAQINKIDMSNEQILAEYDAKMMDKLNIYNYFKYIFFTLIGKGFRDGVGRT